MFRFLAVLLTFSASVTISMATTPAACLCTASGTAVYSVEMEFFWRSPPPPPSTQRPHWSAMVGTTHSPCFTMYTPGMLASQGIKSMAEFGGTSSLFSEFRAAGADTRDGFSGSGVLQAQGTDTASGIKADRYHPLVSATSMIAPSPDWFSAARDINLCNNDTWRQSVTATLISYDAGTDSGLTYNARDAVTNPPQVIELLSNTTTRSNDFKAHNGDIMGELRFTLTSMTAEGGTPSPTCCKASGPSAGQSGQMGDGSTSVRNYANAGLVSLAILLVISVFSL